MVKSSASAKGKSENHRHRRSLVLELITRVGFPITREGFGQHGVVNKMRLDIACTPEAS